MGNWLNSQLTALGVETKLADLGSHVMDGQELPLPPVVLGRIGDDKSKKTVLIMMFNRYVGIAFLTLLFILILLHRLTNRMDGTLIPSL